jgi:hypothetical protein
MGIGCWKPEDWKTYTKTSTSETIKETFVQKNLHPDLDPKGVNRESRDSADHPESHAIAIFFDVTGSMGHIAHSIAKTGLGKIVQEIYNRKPVKDPQILCGAIGDSSCDKVPLQVSQFESDMTMVDQIRKIFVECGGGGNNHESYALPLYFMANHTSIDCYEKRGKRGYIFTIGDELPEEKIFSDHVKKIIGDELQSNLTLDQVLTMVSRQYHVFHCVIEQGNYASRDPDRVKTHWQRHYGQNVIMVSDHTKLAEIIVSTIQVCEGEDVHSVTSSWSGDTSIAVSHSLKGMVSKTSHTGGVVRF